jgi:hypothetical protein
VERAFVEAIEALGGDAPKFEVKGRRGYPDRIGLLPGGRVLFCEAKAPGETPRKDQRARIRKLRKLGFVVAVVDTPAKARRAVDRFDFDPPMLHRR